MAHCLIAFQNNKILESILKSLFVYIMEFMNTKFKFFLNGASHVISSAKDYYRCLYEKKMYNFNFIKYIHCESKLLLH